MRSFRFPNVVLAALIALPLLLATPSVTAQSSPYYVTNGDSHTAWIIQNGALQATFDTAQLNMAYPPAVRATVLLSSRDGLSAAEFSLGGVFTGNTYAGSLNFDEGLDGTTDGSQYNYAVQCCNELAANSVFRTNLHWGNGVKLFDLPQGAGGSGIAYDSSDNTLWVLTMDSTVRHYSLTGASLGTFSSNVGSQCCLAYEQATDTLWMSENNASTIYQFSKTGTPLASITVPGWSPSNQWGGEMPMASAAPDVPATGPLAAGLLALLVLAAALVVFARSRAA